MKGDSRSASEGAQRTTFEVEKEDEGLRLDQLVARRVPGLSRQRARLVIELGGVFVDRARVKILGRRLQSGARVEVNLGGALERASKRLGAAARARDTESLPPYAIVHEDDSIVVVEKPARLLTAPTPESDRHNLADLLGRRLRRRVWVVHRLDLETSGLLVFAKTGEAGRVLASAFRSHDVEREYLAAVAGEEAPQEGQIEAPVGGRSAVSHVSVLEPLAEGAWLVRVRLETGRTHQVRIHMRGVDHPVLGDLRYGWRTRSDPPRLALHACRLGFRHPVTGESLSFESPWPADLAAWLDRLRGRDQAKRTYAAESSSSSSNEGSSGIS
ncbi:MAG: RluA family pseudouridine synthase [Deltaproteobacteria bacterium]|nr:RluA family pseudouridine synthase [Deltaproteobacteria bacterium]